MKIIKSKRNVKSLLTYYHRVLYINPKDSEQLPYLQQIHVHGFVQELHLLSDQILLVDPKKDKNR
jgi:hypothetical protein